MQSTEIARHEYRSQHSNETSPRAAKGVSSLDTLAIWCCYLSGTAAAIGIPFLIALYVSFLTPFGGQIFGAVNDVAAAVQYFLLIPIALVVHIRLRQLHSGRSLIALIAGLTGFVIIVVVQIFLIAGVITFERAFGLGTPGFLLVLYWFLVTGNMGRKSGQFPKSRRLDIFAFLYFGFPFWAFRVGKILRAGRLSSENNRQ